MILRSIFTFFLASILLTACNKENSGDLEYPITYSNPTLDFHPSEFYENQASGPQQISVTSGGLELMDSFLLTEVFGQQIELFAVFHEIELTNESQAKVTFTDGVSTASVDYDYTQTGNEVRILSEDFGNGFVIFELLDNNEQLGMCMASHAYTYPGASTDEREFSIVSTNFCEGTKTEILDNIIENEAAFGLGVGDTIALNMSYISYIQE